MFTGKLKKSTWQLGYPWNIHGLGQVKYGTPSDYLAFVLYFLVIIFSKTLRLWIDLDQMWRKLPSIGVVGPSVALLGPQMPKPSPNPRVGAEFDLSEKYDHVFVLGS